MMRTLALATLALLLVAGCSGSGGTTPPTSSGVDVGVKPTDTTGIIVGVVVDTAIRPLAAVTLTIAGTTLSTTSNQDGAFGFEGLQPGPYFINAHKAGFTDVQQSVDVAVGVADPDPVRIKLQADPLTLAYAVPYQFDGYIECSVVVPAAGIPLCGMPNIIAPGTTKDSNNVFYTLDRPPMRVQSEMVWDTTQSAGDKIELSHAFPCDFGPSNNVCDNGVSSASPIIVISNDTTLGMAGTNYPEGKASIEATGWGAGTDFQARVFAANNVLPEPSPACAVICLFGVGIVFEQQFTIFTHVFYGYEPPTGWTFGTDADGQPPAPPA